MSRTAIIGCRSDHNSADRSRSLDRKPPQDRYHLLIADLLEVTIKIPDRQERVRRLQADQVVDFPTQFRDRFARRDDESNAKKLRADLEELWSAHNRGGDEFTVVSSEYLEVIAVRA